jgi:hypothetical protein
MDAIKETRIIRLKFSPDLSDTFFGVGKNPTQMNK